MDKPALAKRLGLKRLQRVVAYVEDRCGRTVELLACGHEIPRKKGSALVRRRVCPPCDELKGKYYRRLKDPADVDLVLVARWHAHQARMRTRLALDAAKKLIRTLIRTHQAAPVVGRCVGGRVVYARTPTLVRWYPAARGNARGCRYSTPIGEWFDLKPWEA